jgi:hypothetical protein
VFIYLLQATVSAVVFPRYHLDGWIGNYITNWSGSLIGLVLLAPVWTALFRAVILRVDDRTYMTMDVRLARVLRVTFALSVLLMIGGVPLAFALDFVPRLFGGRQIVIYAVVGGAMLCKVFAWWLAFRLAIAPPLAATGRRAQALDTAFTYTSGAVFGVLLTRVIIYVPLTFIVGCIMLVHVVRPDPAFDLLGKPPVIVLITLLTAASELVDGTAMALIAVRLIKHVQERMRPVSGEAEA